MHNNYKSTHLIAVAPMMNYTDRHARYFMRLISNDVRLYTEMISTEAILNGDVDYLLSYDQIEHPIALQLGGSDPHKLAKCAEIGADFGYDEVNLNVGCPSSRVKSANFGACLMLTPNLVAELVRAMHKAVSVPITIKCRIGVDKRDSYEELHHFIRIISESGAQTFIIHARKAWLSGLSPKENRDIPPLQYDVVYKIKQDFPQLNIILNGGVQSLSEIDGHLNRVDGVMIGREVYSNPFLLADIQSKYFQSKKLKIDRFEIIEKLEPYIHNQIKKGVKLASITRHILGLFKGQKKASTWRRYLSESSHKPNATFEVVKNALLLMKQI